MKDFNWYNWDIYSVTSLIWIPVKKVASSKIVSLEFSVYF